MVSTEDILRWKRTKGRLIRLITRLPPHHRGDIIRCDFDRAFQLFANGSAVPYFGESEPSPTGAYADGVAVTTAGSSTELGTGSPTNVTRPSNAEAVKRARAETVAKLINELNDLKPQMFEDNSEYARLRGV